MLIKPRPRVTQLNVCRERRVNLVSESLEKNTNVATDNVKDKLGDEKNLCTILKTDWFSMQQKIFISLNLQLNLDKRKHCDTITIE